MLLVQMKKQLFNQLIKNVRACHLCEASLPLGAKPLIQVHPQAKLLIIGQAPSLKVHETGVLWNDSSGFRLREWLGLSKELFYDEKRIAILPMGFCYPGKGERGDLPPKKECSTLWHHKLLLNMPKIQLTILLGQYAHHAYLQNKRKKSLTETVRGWQDYLPLYIPLPHPSPVNNIWLAKNKWFEQEISAIQSIIKLIAIP